MVRNIKNTLIYYYLYKFRKKIGITLGIIIFNIFCSFFINDLVNVTEIKRLIFIKWAILFVSGIYIYKLFKPSQKKEKIQKIEVKKTMPIEEEILSKKKLKGKSDLIIEKYKKRG